MPLDEKELEQLHTKSGMSLEDIKEAHDKFYVSILKISIKKFIS